MHVVVRKDFVPTSKLFGGLRLLSTAVLLAPSNLETLFAPSAASSGMA